MYYLPVVSKTAHSIDHSIISNMQAYWKLLKIFVVGDSHVTGGTRQISNDSQKYPFVQQAIMFMKLLWSDIAIVILTVESL